MKLINKILIFIILFLSIGLSYYYIQNKKNKINFNQAVINNKAYSKELNNIKNDNIQFQFTIRQMRQFNDSINDMLLSTIEQLQIKESKVKSLQYLLSTTSRVDTIEFHHIDTIFKDNIINVDTIVGDEWYTLKLGLRFPNKIITEPTFKTEKTIVTYDKQEYINPPKKFFLCRWFQKKHTVRHVEIYEKSPYVNDSVQRFIEIVK